jgi:hypothetical protein
MTALTFPSPDHIIAALESLLDTAQRAYDSTDRSDKEERAFWRRQRNAFINAQADVLAGRLPLVSGAAYLMPSASRPGAYHRCYREGGIWLCSCEAGERGDFHRHTALITAIEVALDQLEQGLTGEAEPTEDDEPTDDIEVQYDDIPYPFGIGNPDAVLAIPDDQPADDYSDVGPERRPLDRPELVASLVARLSAARAARYAAYAA